MSFNLPVGGPPNLGGTVNKLYVRTSGSDTTGTGTLANPWRTLAYALKQVLSLYFNGNYFIDITGITETVTGLVLPTPSGAPQFFAVNSQSLLGFVQGQLSIHADLTVSSTIASGNVLSINTDATNGQKTIVTSGGLGVNALRGKIVRQSGSLKGVVKSNTATDILVSFGGSLSAGVAVDLCDPGATLNGGLTITGQLSSVEIEGIELNSASYQGLNIISNAGNVSLIGCKIGALNAGSSGGALGGTAFNNCYILPSTAGTVEVDFGSNITFTNSFMRGMTSLFTYTSNTINNGYFLNRSAFESCGPFFAPVFDVSVISSFIQNCEFTTPSTSAIFAKGSGAHRITGTKFNGCPQAAIRCSGPIFLTLDTIPAGVGNLAEGVKLENGAQCNATFANVALTGATGDCRIGAVAIGTTTWALINAATNNRISDAGANGDNSSAKAA